MARKQVAAGKMSQKELRQYLQSMADEVPDFYDGYDPLQRKGQRIKAPKGPKRGPNGRYHTLKRLNSLDISWDSDMEDSVVNQSTTKRRKPRARDTFNDITSLLDLDGVEGLTDQDRQEMLEIEA